MAIRGGNRYRKRYNNDKFTIIYEQYNHNNYPDFRYLFT